MQPNDVDKSHTDQHLARGLGSEPNQAQPSTGTTAIALAVILGLLGAVLVALGHLPALILIPIAVVIAWRAKQNVEPSGGTEARTNAP